ncbi:hypothetical protein AJ80_09454 [Polytolypa hystricis UAMH7299]|uniref:HhH-GPD domain-containing protein n=1 Tax=Polytolypa hystricis (strain UAMH7299) TaxID=1447883 RepID=A0A2B7WQK0_POLH7|nr:hypothetical protein AJ80_09454 [Polytolypa hystricis UAMH7299]
MPVAHVTTRSGASSSAKDNTRHDAVKAKKKRDSRVRRSSSSSKAAVRQQPLPKSSSSDDGSLQQQHHPFHAPTIFTIGHGTRTLPELIQLLQSAHVTHLIDVRSIPRSFKNPQFNHDTLMESAELHDSAGIEYTWLGPGIGGRRSAKQQPNLERHGAIRVAAFRNYAGYMCTSAFREGLAELKGLAVKEEEKMKKKNNNLREGSSSSGERGHVAIMCSETLWWRCHRRMIADALVIDGWDVEHLGVGKKTMKHELWDIARVDEEGNLVYDVSV